MKPRGGGRLLPVLACLLALGACRRTAKLTRLAEDQLRSPQAWLADERVKLLADYVRIDTTLEQGEERGVEFLRNLLECDGIETEVVCPALRRCNLLARLPGRSRQGALLLLNHVDVARVFPQFWKDAPPFEPMIKNGFLHGRGSYDMKAIALAQAFAMRALKRHGVVPKADVLFLAEADEESGQRWGSQWLLKHRPEWFDGVGNVLNEGGTTETILRDARFWGIETLQSGFALGEFEASDPEPLKNLAKDHASVQVAPIEPHPHVVLGFDLLANHLRSPLTDPLRHLDRVRNNPSELAILPDRYGAFLEGRIFWSPPYPYPPGAKDTYRAFVIVSSPPGIDPGPFLAPILRAAPRRGARVVDSFSSGPTSASPYPSPLTDALHRVLEVRFPGVTIGPVPTYGGSTTSIYFRQRGVPAYGFLPFRTNITDAARRHGNDERIFLRDYVDGVELYQDVLEEWGLIQ